MANLIPHRKGRWTRPLPVYSREYENCDHLIHPPFSRRNETRPMGMVSASLLLRKRRVGVKVMTSTLVRQRRCQVWSWPCLSPSRRREGMRQRRGWSWTRLPWPTPPLFPGHGGKDESLHLHPTEKEKRMEDESPPLHSTEREKQMVMDLIAMANSHSLSWE